MSLTASPHLTHRLTAASAATGRWAVFARKTASLFPINNAFGITGRWAVFARKTASLFPLVPPLQLCWRGFSELCVLFLLVFACAKNPTPEAALLSYVEAVEKKDAKATYRLLNKEMQAQFGSQEKFIEFFNTYYQEIWQEAEQLSTNKKQRLQIEATLPLKNGSQILLRQTPQGWQVFETKPLTRATTVAGALEGLALLAQEATQGPIDFYLSAEAKEERALRLQAFAALVLLVERYNISINDKHATVRLKDGRTLRFYLEDGHWYLVALPEEFLF